MMIQDKTINAKPVRKADKQARAILAGRVLFLSILLTAAALLCVLAHDILSDSETELANKQFDAVAERALSEAFAIMERRRMAAVTLASILSIKFPNASQWPFVTVPQFDIVAANLIGASSSVDMSFAPIVRRRDQAEFEDFAYNYFNGTARERSLNPNTFFGKGIWGYNHTFFSGNNTNLFNAMNPPPGSLYHDIVSETSPEYDDNEVLFPLLNIVPSSVAMLNIKNRWSSPVFDDLIKCTEQRAVQEDWEKFHCTTISEPARIFRHQNRQGALIMEPIFPENNPKTMVGVIITTLLFDELLGHMFSDQVSGIDCVIESEEFAVLYSIQNGEPIFKAIETHEEHITTYKVNPRKVEKFLTPTILYNTNSSLYKVDIYPNDAIYAFYRTDNPATAVVGVIIIVLGMSLAFLTYDTLVRREFTAKKELLQAKRHFMRYVSHEVRTPLNAVYLGLQVMHSELAAGLSNKSSMLEQSPHSKRSTACGCDDIQLNMNEEWLSLTEEIQSNVQGAISVLNDLLNYDKIEQGSMHLDLSLINPWKQTEAIYKEFNLAAKKKQLTYELIYSVKRNGVDGSIYHDAQHIPEEIQCFQLVGDKIRLSQVLRNLVSNSLKFTQEHGCLRIFVTLILCDDELQKDPEMLDQDNGPSITARKAGKLAVSVEDSGAGMDAEQLSMLFREGVQFNPNELQMGQGSGLGLFIAKGIVEQHGGTLTAKSDGLNKGCTFTVTLNMWQILVPVDLNDANSSKTTTTTTTPTLSSSLPSDTTEESLSKRVSLRVLIVDDVSSNRKLLSRLLSHEGHICEQADDGEVAVAMVLEAIESGSPFDAILMDYEMPKMNGPAAAEEIRRLGIHVHIVGVTGNMLPRDVEYYRTCGADAVLGKPLKMSDLEELWTDSGLLRH